MKKAVSVIIPVYNGEGALEKCLDAIVGQEGMEPGAFEVIAVDNASTDGTAGIIGRYGKRHGCVRGAAETRRSSYAARNRGIGLARGRYLVFTDVDCVPSPRWLASYLSMARKLRRKERGPFLIGGAVNVRLRDRDNPYEVYDWLTQLNQELFVTEKGFAATANLLVDRRVFDAVGLFDPALISGGDGEFGRRATARFPMHYSPDASVTHDARGSRKSVAGKNYRIAIGYSQVYLKEHGRRMPAREMLRHLVPNLGYLNPGAFPRLTVESDREVPAGAGLRFRLLMIDIISRYQQFLGRCDGAASAPVKESARGL